MSERPFRRPRRHTVGGGADDGRMMAGELDRRRFLQVALGGGVAAAGMSHLAIPGTARAATTRVSSAVLADAFQGTVVGIKGDQFTVNTALPKDPEILRVTTITPETLVDSMSNALPAVGDNLLVRTVIPGQAEKAWVNRVSFDARITQQASNGLQVTGAHPWGGAPITIDVPTNSDTVWYRSGSNEPCPPPTAPLANAYIIGYRVGDSAAAATTVAYMTQADLEDLQNNPPATLQATQVQIETAPDVVTCYMQWSGSASTFCCPGCNAPECGTGWCSNSANDQAAWPRTLGIENCDNGCTTQCALKCGDSFQIWNCYVDGYWLEKVDIGPCQLSGPGCDCGTETCYLGCPGDPCGDSKKPRVVDLTPTTAAVVLNGYGCSSCTVGFVCSCSDCTCPY